MSDGGKGSAPRPYSVPLKDFQSNWDAIFGKDKLRQQDQRDKKVVNNERKESK